jgi:glycine/D-amino acid oxidase-like deaminating enzyme
MVETNILIIGGGFAGLSTAYHLAKGGQKGIVVIEAEKKLGGHSSGRNAGMIRQAVSDPVLLKLAREGCRALASAEKRGFGRIGFRSNGSLLLAKGREAGELEKTRKALGKEGVSCGMISAREAAARVPLLDGGDFRRALYCPSDAFVDIEALLGGFLKALEKYRVPVRLGEKVLSIQKRNGGFCIRTQKSIFTSGKIVNAAGACAGWIGRKAGALTVPFRPYRRHLFIGTQRGLAKADWPFVWDLSHQFYFRPVREGRLLLSPCDRGRMGRDYPVRGREEVDSKMKGILEKKLQLFSERLGSVHFGKPKSGLRTMAPDERFVIGEDPRQKSFFWVAGLGGHGVTTSFSVGRLASDLILGKKHETYLAKALSPKRFYAS